MKVAILGAGLAGLSCAIYLENNGIHPTIFERRHKVGERFPNMEAVMQLIYRPIKDPIIFINKKFGFNIMPNAITHTLEINSPNNKATLTGYNIGYTTIRGNHKESLESQLAGYVKSNIVFNSNVRWQDLEKDYDRIIVATGDPIISMELGVWKTDTEAFLKGCIVKGKFDLGAAKIWLDQSLSKQCMVYFAPFSTNEASYCTVAIPSSLEELDILWTKTVAKLNFTPVPGTEFKFEEYKLGRVSTKQIGKIMLVGAAGGFVEPFMGFGQIPSILSGIYAAISIIEGKDFNKLTKWLDKLYMDCLTLRKYADSSMDNDSFDKLVYLLNLPPIKNLSENSNFPLLKVIARSVGLVMQ
ncbi:MAG: FAD-dependent oxidoreductase [Bacillota bacterium]